MAQGGRPNQTLSMALMLLLLMASPWMGVIEPAPPALNLEEQTDVEATIESSTVFPKANGFTYTNLSQSPTTSLTTLTRPSISWTSTLGQGLSALRTGGCMAYLPSTNEVFFIGGRTDADPLQTGDESATKLVEVFDVVNKTWMPTMEQLEEEQQYHKCAVANNKIYAIGDYYPAATPSIRSTGLVQVYDPNAGNWSYGTSMPANRSVGLSGVAEHNGMIYVAGGVSLKDRSDSTDRLLRYDPLNDSWTQLQSMNNRRHSFDLVSFRGKLIAFGGVAVFFDPVANTTVERETNLTEAYDPITNTWSQLPNASHAFSAYSSAVFNDEIVIFGGYSQLGWQGTANDKTYGYDPFINRWTTHTTFPIGIYDSSMVRANNTLVFAGGDASSSRFSTWSIQYLAETEYYTNPSMRQGWLVSPIHDLRGSAEGSASLLWMTFSTIQPTGTTLGLQYRTASTPQGIASAPWRPSSVPVNTFASPGNISLADIMEDAPYLQFRCKYTTTRLMEWVTPTLTGITIGADSVGFVNTPPSSMQPTSTPITITTTHHATTQDGDYRLSLHPSDALGGYDQSSQWTHLKWNSSTASLTIDDPDGLLFSSTVSAQSISSSSSGETMNWTFSLSGATPTDYLRMRVTTLAERNSTYVVPDPISIDRDVQINVVNITADFSSTGDATVEEDEVLPGNTQLNISIDHFFKNSGLRLMGGTIQARIHMDLQSYETDVDGKRIWYNDTTSWFNLPAGQLYHALVNAPTARSGDMHVWFETRTSEAWALFSSTEPHRFVLNGAGPTLLSVSPSLDVYINKDAYRTVSMVFHDVGGFTNETLHAFTWLEGRDDGTNGQPADGIPQREEYIESDAYIHQSGHEWTVNVTVNDTINADHQWGRVLLEGTDVAGYSIANASAADGHARWESRTPSKATLNNFQPTQNLLSSTLMRLEPSQSIGWALTVEDANGLTDLLDIRLELGNDDRLGLKYDALDQTCSSLDERLQILPTGCVATMEGNALHLNLTATVEWSLTDVGLSTGEIDVTLRDLDGTQRYDFSEAWVLERQMSINVVSLLDEDGPVQQPIEEGVSVMAGDHLNLTANIAYLTSGTPYSGDLRLQWNGQLQSNDWRGGMVVSVIEGVLTASIPTPESSGLIHGLTLSLWDPLQTEQLSATSVGSFLLDNDPPILAPSSIAATISRYHLDAVDIGLNIIEPQAWTSPVELTCQVKSISGSWDSVVLTRNATTVFDGKTMFSFTFDFSQMGDPSTLSQQATLACWAMGMDDAGWTLSSAVGNSELDPWLEAPLNNIGPDLALENVVVNTDVAAGEKVRLSFNVVNGGEGVDTPFNATIEIVQGEQRTMVGRSIFYSMDENTAKSVKRSFEAPAGQWTLEITVDQEQLVWEIDETNNLWSTSVSASSGGLGSMAVFLSATAFIGLIGAVFLMRKRSAPAVDEDKLVAALAVTNDAAEETSAAETTPHQRRGPPGKVATSSTSAQPTRGPPRGPPKPTAAATTASTDQDDITPQAMAAQYLQALGPATPIEPEETDATRHVSDYSQLPGGGEYEYTPEGTFYIGASCGRWRLNDDKSFTRLSDE